MKEGQILAKKVFTQNQLSSPGGTVVLFPSLSNEGHPYKQGPSPMKITAKDQRRGRNTALTRTPTALPHYAHPMLCSRRQLRAVCRCPIRVFLDFHDLDILQGCSFAVHKLSLWVSLIFSHDENQLMYCCCVLTAARLFQ